MKIKGPGMKLPVCSVAMTVDYNKNVQLQDIMLRDCTKDIIDAVLKA